MRLLPILRILAVILLLVAPPPLRVRAATDSPKPSATAGGLRAGGESGRLEFQERVVAGGPQDFMEVRSLVLRGSNHDIGKKLAEIARDRHGVQIARSTDPLRTRAQRRWLKQFYPIFLERMRGVADAYSVDPEDDAYDTGGLGYLLSPPGCSVVFYPPDYTELGKGVLSRNYDFTTGTLHGTPPGRGEMPATARPYVIELHPDAGYASLYLCSYDFLGGTIDGINSEGLCAALLADDELMAQFPMEPTGEAQVGLNELQVLRYLLDTCADVEEAKQALLMAKQYYSFVSCHYIVADRHGKSFVWEYSQAHNGEHIIDGAGRPQVTTNFMLHRHASGPLPAQKSAKGMFNRWRILDESIAAATGKCSLGFIKEANSRVAADVPVQPGQGDPPARTLWHALYVPEDRSLQVSFYLRDEPDPATPRHTRIARSEYVDFRLRP